MATMVISHMPQALPALVRRKTMRPPATPITTARELNFKTMATTLSPTHGDLLMLTKMDKSLTILLTPARLSLTSSGPETGLGARLERATTSWAIRTLEGPETSMAMRRGRRIKNQQSQPLVALRDIHLLGSVTAMISLPSSPRGGGDLTTGIGGGIQRPTAVREARFTRRARDGIRFLLSRSRRTRSEGTKETRKDSQLDLAEDLQVRVLLMSLFLYSSFEIAGCRANVFENRFNEGTA